MCRILGRQRIMAAICEQITLVMTVLRNGELRSRPTHRSRQAIESDSWR